MPRLKNGPNGTSVLREIFFLKNKSKIPKTAPIQKESIKALIAPFKPRKKPAPKNNLESPSPIHLPFEITQSKKRKAAGIMLYSAALKLVPKKTKAPKRASAAKK